MSLRSLSYVNVSEFVMVSSSCKLLAIFLKLHIGFICRKVRAVVARLRQSFLETNEEIRSLIRAKAMIEKAHEHTRKDIQLNKDSITGREARPQREKVNQIILHAV